ncbi:MAG TPA: fructose-bisphosphate aldolase class I, partial [Parvularcula sp.]|nr:fructose-bisphosphate aldolase class I [Parvularcula sp.]
MQLDVLNKIAVAMVAPGKGILAADESSSTIKKRFDAIGVESTPDNRRDYREMLFRTKEAMENYISGVILYDETIRQTAKDGTPLVKLIEQAGAIPGIKVDAGAKALAAFPGEQVTEGLDGLRERLAEYHGLGARFAKWRAVIDIGRNGSRAMPSYGCLRANIHALGRYAALCQEAGIVPIVEPEVLMDGDHDIDRCFEVTEMTLGLLFEELYFAREIELF